MDVTVVYEGSFNNTRSIAEAILAGAQDVHPCIRVHMESTSTLPRDGVVRPDLLIVGSPAGALRMSASALRHHGAQPGTRRVSMRRAVKSGRDR
jgi:flavorubredoxin